MNNRKVETVDIGRGVQYAKVAARSAEFHKDNDVCSIETSCEFKEGFVMFRATVHTKKGTFTGHSMDKIGGRQKQFEKQETIAVGRALAFAGYLSSGDIACAEEMVDVISDIQLTSLKKKYFDENEAELKKLDRPGRQQAFNAWARDLIGEDRDFNDKLSWCDEWYQEAWKSLQGVSADVPFEGANA